MEYSEIGARIAKLRIEKHYTREAFAEMVPMSPKFLYEVETGKKGISVMTLYHISEALAVRCDYLVKGKE